MIVTDSNGCTSNLIKTIVVTPSPQVDFIANPNFSCTAPFNAIFVDNSVVSGSATYSWDFGDGSPPSTFKNPTHWYNNLGSYTVKLVVNNNGCLCRLCSVERSVVDNNDGLISSSTDICTQYVKTKEEKGDLEH